MWHTVAAIKYKFILYIWLCAQSTRDDWLWARVLTGKAVVNHIWGPLCGEGWNWWFPWECISSFSIQLCFPSKLTFLGTLRYLRLYAKKSHLHFSFGAKIQVHSACHRFEALFAVSGFPPAKNTSNTDVTIWAYLSSSSINFMSHARVPTFLSPCRRMSLLYLTGPFSMYCTVCWDNWFKLSTKRRVRILG